MEPPDHPIVIMGTGIPGVCALINRLVDYAFNAPDDRPPIPVYVLDTLDRRKPSGKAPFPLHGISIDAIHPFKTAAPAPAFPTFGDYAREIALEDAEWTSALGAPTFRHVNEYVEYLLELAVRAVGAKVLLEAGMKPIKGIEETVPNGPATIHFIDGTTLHAKQLVRAAKPPHMSGPAATFESFFPKGDPVSAISRIVDQIWPPATEEEHDMQRMIAAYVEDENRFRAAWELWPLRMAGFRFVSSRAFGSRRAERDAIEREVTRLVGARVPAADFPGDDPGGWFKDRLERYRRAIEAVSPDDEAMGGAATAAARAFAKVMGPWEKFVIPVAEKDFGLRCHAMAPLCRDLALDGASR